MDKLIHNPTRTIITNDGATVMKELDIVHPAAGLLVQVAKGQDEEIGDGTTSVVVLSCAFLDAARSFLEEGVHPQFIARCYRDCLKFSLAKLEKIAVTVDGDQRDVLRKCAATTLRSKLVAGHRHFFASMIVEAVEALDENLRLEDLGVRMVKGGGIEESFFVSGVAFKRTFHYAGFDQQPKSFENAKILLLNVEFELAGASTDSEVRVDDAQKFQAVVDAEWRMLFNRLEDCVNSGANIVLSQKPVGDVATQFFADHNVFCAGRVPAEDMQRTAKATGGSVLAITSGIEARHLGHCAKFEERQVGSKRYNLFRGCPGKAATIVLRGGAKQFLEEAKRSVHDAIMIVRRAKKAGRVVGGGGAVEMIIASELAQRAMRIEGKAQLIQQAYARALESIPRALVTNAGFDSFGAVFKLRSAHAGPEVNWTGVDIETGGTCDALAGYIWEPLVVKMNAMKAATEAACTILSIDETVAIPAHDSTFNTDAAKAYAGGQGARGPTGVPARPGGIPGFRPS